MAPSAAKRSEYHSLCELLEIWEVPLPKVRLEQENGGAWHTTLTVLNLPSAYGEDADMNLGLDAAALEVLKYFKMAILNSSRQLASQVNSSAHPRHSASPSSSLRAGAPVSNGEAYPYTEPKDGSNGPSAPRDASLVAPLAGSTLALTPSMPIDGPLKIEHEDVVVSAAPSASSSASSSSAPTWSLLVRGADSIALNPLAASENSGAEEPSFAPLVRKVRFDLVCFRNLNRPTPTVRLTMVKDPITPLENNVGLGVTASSAGIPLGSFRVRWEAVVSLGGWPQTP